MPFHRHSQSASEQNAQPFGAVAGFFQAAQTLGSIGAPTGNLKTATTGTTTAGTDSFLPTNSSSAAPPPLQPSTFSSGPTNPAMSVPSTNNSNTNSTQSFETPRRLPAYGRPSDELHLSPPSGGISQRGPKSPREFPSGAPPRINLEQGTPEASQYQGQAKPAFQLGSSRPGPLASNTAPTIPTMAQDPYTTPGRPATLNHNYSRSSPSTGFEGQTFTPFSNAQPAVEPGQYSSPTTQKYTPQNQTRNVSSAPLGLADIRPRADSNLAEALPGANPYSYDGANAVPTNSNYLAPWAIYAFDWCKWPAQGQDAGKVAVGSYLEDGHNFVRTKSLLKQSILIWLQIQILESQIVPSSSDSYIPGAPKYGLEFNKIAEATHSYPVTRLLWEPPSSQKQSTDLLATSGDHLRLWSLPSDTPMSTPGNSITRSANHGRDQPPTKLTPLALLSNSKTPEHTAPLTSLDWNTVSPSLIITSSIDTTCTIWDIPTLTAKTQLIAHDKEVFDVRFCANSVDVFVSCGADGSVRMFDLRSLEHSTIIYEPTAKDDKGQLLVDF
jgi:WD repeat-containing protein 68